MNLWNMSSDVIVFAEECFIVSNFNLFFKYAYLVHLWKTSYALHQQQTVPEKFFFPLKLH